MANILRSIRRRILTPNISETKLETRGFYQRNAASVELLETVGATFLTGYGYAAECRIPADAQARLETVPKQFRGFAYEGAAMGLAVRDTLPGSSGRNVAAFLDGRGDAHIYMAYVGVGWAMARAPRFRWSRLYAPDPLLRWLVLDGYGFHQAYFHTKKYVHEHYREARFPWPADDRFGYADRVIDQGIGRAAWFVGGTDVRQVAMLLDSFPEERRPDLYSGAGLAATYAGGADETELRWFFEHAGPYRGDVAQGSAFAAGARVRADLVMPNTELATQVFCGMSAADAWTITENAIPAPSEELVEPAYETWRKQIAGAVVSVRG
jgi:hypothetical protein